MTVWPESSKRGSRNRNKRLRQKFIQSYSSNAWDVLDGRTRKETIESLATHRASTQLRVLLAVWWIWTPWTFAEARNKLYLAGVLNDLNPGWNASYSQWLIALARRDGPTLAKLAHDPTVAALPAFAKVLMGIALRSRAAREGRSCAVPRGVAVASPGSLSAQLPSRISLLRSRPRRTEVALRYLTAAVSIRKADWRGYNYLGVAYRLNGEFGKAIAAYHRAIELDPNAGPPYRHLADLMQPKEWRRKLWTYFGRPANSRLLARPSCSVWRGGFASSSNYARDVRQRSAAPDGDTPKGNVD